MRAQHRTSLRLRQVGLGYRPSWAHRTLAKLDGLLKIFAMPLAVARTAVTYPPLSTVKTTDLR